ncbi:MAG TPA: Hsp20/alpha crystallin family protein [Geobacteraceae bacterium]|nr:Hsp20/alpha crystallin family protein [Geobacteraceae bacterium]
MKDQKNGSKEEVQEDVRIKGILDGLTGFVHGFGDLAKAGERLSRRKTEGEEGRKSPQAGKALKNAGSGFSGILNGLTDLAEKLQEMSEKGETLSKTGEFTVPGKGKGMKGVYGFTMRTGLGEQQDRVRVEPFGNIKRDKDTGQTVVQEIREPLVDIFEEEDCTLLVIEMPGITTKDIRLEVRDDVLAIFAEKGDKKYRKEVLLKHGLSMDRITMTCNNGIVEIKCCK